MDVGETSGGHLKIAYGRSGVTSHLGPLARDALACPFGTLRVDVRPHEFAGDRLRGSVCTGVTKIMYGFENIFPHG